MRTSVIIPTFNEAANIGQLVTFLRQHAPSEGCEIIVVDGGSTDNTLALAKRAGARAVRSPHKGRAAQMNHGAQLSAGEILYFVHADVRPPVTWATDIATAIGQGARAGCFSYRFDSDSALLRFNARLTRLDWLAVGGGDQTLFILHSCFEALGGFRNLRIMEDFDLVWRFKKKHPFRVIRNDAVVSARKYEEHSWLYVQLVNVLTVLLFKMNFPQERLHRMYQSLLRVR